MWPGARLCLTLLPVLAGAGDALAQSRGPTRPPAQVTVINAGSLLLAGVEIATRTAEPQIVGELPEALAPGKTVRLRLKGQVGCDYSVRAVFEDGSESEPQTVNLCKDPVLRFVDE